MAASTLKRLPTTMDNPFPEFPIFSPSYKRAGRVTTHLIVPRVVYVVAENEADEYRKQSGVNVWAVPNTAQGSVCRIRNYILNNCGSKQLMILDDDIKKIGFHHDKDRFHTTLTPEQIDWQFGNAMQMAIDADIRFWGIQILPDRKAYRSYSPINLTACILGPVQGFNNLDLRYDEKLPLKEDYDLSLQVLNKYRRVLRINFLFYDAMQNEMTGGCSTYRNMEREKDQLKALQMKWGSKIVRQDHGNAAKANKNSKKKTLHDINPIIKFPIPGM
jgi:hypothetical protein